MEHQSNSISMSLATFHVQLLAAEKGILALPDPKNGHGLSNTIVDLVHQFYYDDEFIRLMHEQKEVQIGSNKYKNTFYKSCETHSNQHLKIQC